jgi:hypothetical protein
MLGGFSLKCQFWKKKFSPQKALKTLLYKKCGVPTNLDLFKANKQCHVSPLWLFRLEDKCVCNKSFRVKFY